MTRIPLPRRYAVVVSVLAVLAWAGLAPAAVMPYVQNFASDPGWTTGTAGAVDAGNTWAKAASGQWAMQVARTGSGSITEWSSVSISNVTAAGFEVQATLNMPSLCTNGFNDSVGLRFLAASATSDTSSYDADVNIGDQNPGRIRIVAFNSSGAATIYPSSTQTSQGGPVPNFNRTGTYLLDVKGTYNTAGALTVDFKVTDELNSANTSEVTNLVLNGVTVGPDTNPPSGQYFGFRAGIGSSGAASLDSNFSNFSVTAAPEPASLALVALGGLLLLPRRRARH